jgi:hypothetical protein
MKQLEGFITTKDGNQIPLDAKSIVLTLSHGRQVSIRREDVRGSDGLSLCCGIESENPSANGRFVIRAQNFCSILLTVEPAK